MENRPAELNTMISEEDEPSSVLNGRLRPRKSTATIPNPPTKSYYKPEYKVAQDKPKRNNIPSKASPNKQDDLTANADSSPIAQFLCPYCDRKFTTKLSACKHARRIHLCKSKQDNFINCLFCNHSEAAPADIIRHMVDNHPNKYVACVECKSRFLSTADLEQHKLNVCEKQKQAYRSKLRQKTSTISKKDQRKVNVEDTFPGENKELKLDHEFNNVVISCELKPSQVHEPVDIEDKITTNLIMPSNIRNTVLQNNAVIILDDIQWNRRIPPNFSFRNADADQILSRLGVVHRSPRVGESTRREWLKLIDDNSQKFEKCFDTNFYSRVTSNVQENLARFLDGSFNFSPDPDKVIKTRKSKSSAIINTAEGFPILLPHEQYSRNRFDGYMPRAIAPKHKWKWDSTENEKHIIIDANVIKRDNHVDNCIITLVSSLDIWTQLRMRRKFEDIFCKATTEKIEKQNIIGRQLKEILESREIPRSKLQMVAHTSSSTVAAPTATDAFEFPSFLGLCARGSDTTKSLQPVPTVLSGEWVRPRCYVCCACGDQTHESRALTTHMASHHPNAQVQHYEIVGESLLNADILKHLYVPSSQMSNRTRPLRGFRDCTKCKKSIALEELHQHMLDCAGDTPMVRRKCRSRPFGVRKRRPRLTDNALRKKIRKDLRTRHNQKSLRTRPRLKTEVGDAETIRKMLADLPAKRHRSAEEHTDQQVPRPRRKLDKQRNKLKIKRLALKDTKTRKVQIEEGRNDSSTIDEDDQPLKPKTELTIPAKKRFSSRVLASKNKKESTAAKDVSASNEHQQKSPTGDADSSQPHQISRDDSTQRLNFTASENNNVEAENLDRSDNNEEREPAEDWAASDHNLLINLTNNITASTSTLQLQQQNLPQQTNSEVTLRETKNVLLENEVDSSIPDKPHLRGNQKSSSEKKRQSLLNCIEKIKSQQKGETMLSTTSTTKKNRKSSEPIHMLQDPNPAMVVCTRDESGAAKNVIPDKIHGPQRYMYPNENYGTVQRPLDFETQRQPNETGMIAPIPINFQTIYQNALMTYTTQRNKSSGTNYTVQNYDHMTQYRMLHPPLFPPIMAFNPNTMLHPPTIQAAQNNYPLQYHGCSIPGQYDTSDINYSDRHDHMNEVYRLNEPTQFLYNQQALTRGSSQNQRGNKNHTVQSMLSKSANETVFPNTGPTAQKRVSESSETDLHSNPWRLIDGQPAVDQNYLRHASFETTANNYAPLISQGDTESPHNDPFKRPKPQKDIRSNKIHVSKSYTQEEGIGRTNDNQSAFREVTSIRDKHYHTRPSQNTAAKYSNTVSPKAVKEGHSIPRSGIIVDEHKTQEYLVSLFSKNINENQIHERFSAEHPHLSPSVPTETQAAKLTPSPNDSIIQKTIDTPDHNGDNIQSSFNGKNKKFGSEVSNDQETEEPFNLSRINRQAICNDERAFGVTHTHSVLTTRPQYYAKNTAQIEFVQDVGSAIEHNETNEDLPIDLSFKNNSRSIHNTSIETAVSLKKQDVPCTMEQNNAEMAKAFESQLKLQASEGSAILSNRLENDCEKFAPSCLNTTAVYPEQNIFQKDADSQHNDFLDKVSQMPKKEGPVKPLVTDQTRVKLPQYVEDTSIDSNTPTVCDDLMNYNNNRRLTINTPTLPSSSILPKKRHSPSSGLSSQDAYSYMTLSKSQKQQSPSTITSIHNINDLSNALGKNSYDANKKRIDKIIDLTDDDLNNSKINTPNPLQESTPKQQNTSKNEKTASLRAVRFKAPSVRKSITDEKQLISKTYSQQLTCLDLSQKKSIIDQTTHFECDTLNLTVDNTAQNAEYYANICTTEINTGTTTENVVQIESDTSMAAFEQIDPVKVDAVGYNLVVEKVDSVLKQFNSSMEQKNIVMPCILPVKTTMETKIVGRQNTENDTFLVTSKSTIDVICDNIKTTNIISDPMALTNSSNSTHPEQIYHGVGNYPLDKKNNTEMYMDSHVNATKQILKSNENNNANMSLKPVSLQENSRENMVSIKKLNEDEDSDDDISLALIVKQKQIEQASASIIDSNKNNIPKNTIPEKKYSISESNKGSITDLDLLAMDTTLNTITEDESLIVALMVDETSEANTHVIKANKNADEPVENRTVKASHIKDIEKENVTEMKQDYETSDLVNNIEKETSGNLSNNEDTSENSLIGDAEQTRVSMEKSDDNLVFQNNADNNFDMEFETNELLKKNNNESISIHANTKIEAVVQNNSNETYMEKNETQPSSYINQKVNSNQPSKADEENVSLVHENTKYIDKLNTASEFQPLSGDADTINTNKEGAKKCINTESDYNVITDSELSSNFKETNKKSLLRKDKIDKPNYNENKTMKPEKTNTCVEIRTTCYNRPIGNNQTSTSIPINKPENYDPYDIDLDMDMVETPRPTMKRKGNKTVSGNNINKSSKNILSNEDPVDIICQELDLANRKPTITTPPTVSDSDSSISDAPLQKYVEEKEKSNAENRKSSDSNKFSEAAKDRFESDIESANKKAHFTSSNDKEASESKAKIAKRETQLTNSTNDISEQNIIGIEDITSHRNHDDANQITSFEEIEDLVDNSKSDVKQKKNRGSIISIGTESDSIPEIGNKTEQQLNPDKFMENFGFYIKRQRRLCNIVALKKITETFQNFKNDEDSLVTEDRQKKSSHIENKKTSVGARTLKLTQDTNNANSDRKSRTTLQSTQPQDTSETNMIDKQDPANDDGEVDVTMAQNMLETEDIHKIERELYSELKKTALANAGKTSELNHLRTEETNFHDNDIHDVATRVGNDTEMKSPENRERIEKCSSPEMPESPESVIKDKPLMYPEEEVNIYEDKYDIIKRRRTATANAKQVPKIDKPRKSKIAKRPKKSERKNIKKITKKTVNQGSQVPTKGALKGFDGIKISIPTQDLNMPPNVSPPHHQQKQSRSRKRKETFGKANSGFSYKSDSDTFSKEVVTPDIYEFKDDERPVTEDYRLIKVNDKRKSSKTENDESLKIATQNEIYNMKGNEHEIEGAKIRKYEGKGKGKGKGKRTNAANDTNKEIHEKQTNNKKEKHIKEKEPESETEHIMVCEHPVETIVEDDDGLSNDSKNNLHALQDNVELFEDSDTEMQNVMPGTLGFVPDRNDESSYESDSSSRTPLLSVLKGPYVCTCLSEIDSDDSETERGCGHSLCRYSHLNTAKNTVMGKIFKSNAVRCEKPDESPKESPKPKPDLDRLFDSLLEPNTNNNATETRNISPVPGPSSASTFHLTMHSQTQNINSLKEVSIGDSDKIIKRVLRCASPASSNDINWSKVDDATYKFGEKTDEPIYDKKYIMLLNKHVQTDVTWLQASAAYDLQVDLKIENEPELSLKTHTLSYDKTSNQRLDMHQSSDNTLSTRGTQTKRSFPMSDIETSSCEGELNASKNTKRNRREHKKHKSHHKRNKIYQDKEFDEPKDNSKATASKQKSTSKIAIGESETESIEKKRFNYSTDPYVMALIEDTGVAIQRARRKCTVGKQNVLAEHWSSSESEAASAPNRAKGRKSSLCKKISRTGKKEHASKRSRGGESDDDDGEASGMRAAAGTSKRARAASAVVDRDRDSGSDAERDVKQEQHGWIVGHSHKKLVTMLACCKSKPRLEVKEKEKKKYEKRSH